MTNKIRGVFECSANCWHSSPRSAGTNDLGHVFGVGGRRAEAPVWIDHRGAIGWTGGHGATPRRDPVTDLNKIRPGYGRIG